ncbi:hypothetical protein GA417_05565 [Poseidonibacter ostreae]|uniref:hypothetical protein n=1 Tax=Poseidonibacter ostreae TaxID=2654171 RepID=UPI0012651719|nr:hypothetical protein [Poseidonibacter ostreae]KAB7886418.1 hypothetical protein GA417_05565 [Poseidonibacter ostreae]
MVITPLTREELTSYFDDTAISVIQYFLKKSILSQPERIEGQADLPIQIPKEHIEQWIVQSLGANSIGAGSYPIDVYLNDWGADVKMLSCKIDKEGNLKNADSGETSLAQKFSDGNFGDNNSLDALFNNREFLYIWDRWKDIIINKYERVEKDLNINRILYFFILRAGTKFHLCGVKLNLRNLKSTSINEERSTNDSIWINDFIDLNYGHTKIYKAKKRFELRLKPKYWFDNNKLLTFDTNFEQSIVNIRELVENNDLSEYIENNLIPIIRDKS